MPAREAGATKTRSNPEGDILPPMFNVSIIEKQKKPRAEAPLTCDLGARRAGALLPVVAELADQIEGAGDENGVFWRGSGEGLLEGTLGLGDHGKPRGVVAGNFRELRGGDGARGAGRGEDDFRGVWEEQAGDFVDGFVAEGGVDQPDFRAGKVLFEKMSQLAGGAGIVRAIEINVGGGLQFLEAAGPDGASDAAGEGLIGDFEAAVFKKSRGGDGVQ